MFCFDTLNICPSVSEVPFGITPKINKFASLKIHFLLDVNEVLKNQYLETTKKRISKKHE